MINWIVAATLFAKIWKVVSFLLLCFGSLLWVISIVAVLWGIFDGFIPAIRRRQYEKASVIFLIVAVTTAIILLSVNEQANYLFGFIIPIILLNLYIKKYIQLPTFQKNNFRNN